MSEYHVPIMLDKIVEYLNIKADGVYFDGTLGGGGHSEAILSRLSPEGRLIAVDRDSDAIMYAGERLCKYRNLTIVHDNYENAGAILDNMKVKLDGALIDLGISSHQIDCAERGFSYMRDGSLDMRMDRTQFLTAFNVVNEYSAGELMRILRDYGEEKYSWKIAEAIVAERNKMPIRTTTQLASIVEGAVPKQKGGHPAKKTFQAVRIEVNGELSGLGKVVDDLVSRLKVGGRLAVITFHSLEDRIVKERLKEHSIGCLCDKKLPLCVCGHKASIKLIAKAEMADEREQEDNSRSACAKLRVAERI